MPDVLFQDLLLKARQLRNNLEAMTQGLPIQFNASPGKRFEMFKTLVGPELGDLTPAQLAELNYNLSPIPRMTEEEANELMREAEKAGYTVHN